MSLSNQRPCVKRKLKDTSCLRASTANAEKWVSLLYKMEEAMMKRLLFLAVLVFSLSYCAEDVNPNYQKEAADPEFLHTSMQQLTDVIVHDIFSPPVASRIYAYPSIAAYEIVRHDHPEYRSLAGQLNELKPLPQPDLEVEYCFPLAATHAFLTVGKALIFSEEKMAAFEQAMYADFEALNMPHDVYNRSMDYGKAVAGHILAWANQDRYKETRTYPKYAISADPTRWEPTPPAYMDGIEPHWREIRTFVLDSAQQYVPPRPTPVDISQGSAFYKEVMEVYHSLKTDDPDEKSERIEIAKFWDCNPYVSHTTGHVMYATKKITPGGHWIGITKIACQTASADLITSAQAYALTSIALADAFISCWDEKYRSNLVRPETVINKYLDEEWRPLLQTPPFPEYTSGHSVISRAAAIVLTDLFGDHFAFDDTTEEAFGLPMRSYNSFLEASEEAAISRLYGGIHYRPAIDEGVRQGEKVGRYVVQQLQWQDAALTQQ